MAGAHMALRARLWAMRLLSRVGSGGPPFRQADQAPSVRQAFRLRRECRWPNADGRQTRLRRHV